MEFQRQLYRDWTHQLSATRRFLRRELRSIWSEIRQTDVRKPMHALIVGAIIGGMAAPAINYIVTELRYDLSSGEQGVVAKADSQLTKMWSVDQKNQFIYFNKDGQPPPGGYDETQIGAGKSKNQIGYSAKLPMKVGGGIAFSDVQYKTTVTMAPQYNTLDGRVVDGRAVYPLQNEPGALTLTPKGNGLKEDIALASAPADTATYDYKLTLDSGLQAKMESNGMIGVYSADPSLYGNITYSTEKDRQSVENAREKGAKNFLMFEIPAPAVKQADGQGHGVKAHFVLNGSDLSVVVSGLNKASYPLSIDPSFVITSVSDFLLGKVEDNITVTQPTGDGQLNRATITAGLTGSWGTAVSGNLPAGCSDTGGVNFNFGLTAYGGYLYLVGGGNTATNGVCYAALNSNGTLGTWNVGSHTYAVARIGGTVVGFNGFLYIIDGEDQSTGNTQYSSIEFAQVQTNGDVGAWCSPAGGTCPGTFTNSSSFSTGTFHTYGGGVEYNGFIYMCGGATAKKNQTVINTCEYTAINSDGTLYKPSSSCTLSGTATVWCTASSFTTARNRFKMVAYNGYIYLVGGYAGGTGGAVFSDVQYVPILSSNALGTWTTLSNTPLPTTDRNYGLAAEEGHIYVIGGCSAAPACGSATLSSTYYAVLNADGTIGAWDTTSTLGTAVFMQGVASYSGYLYSIGGCTVEPTNANGCNTELGASNYASISQTPGDTTANLTTGGTIATAQAGTATAAYDGFLYEVGGCSGTSCGTFNTTVDQGTVNDNGSVTWTTTGQTQLAAGRAFGALEAYGNKLFYLGGETAAGTYTNSVLDGTISSGAVTAWATDANTFANARGWLAGAQWNNYLYVVGGYDGTTYYHDVQYTKISSGVPSNPGCGTVWCATTSWGSTGEAGVGAAVYAGYLYVVGGRNGTTASTTMYQAPITNSSGALGSFSTSGTSLPTTADSYMSIVIHNNVIYALGGMTPNTGNAPSTNIACASLNGSTGVVGAWTVCSKSLTTARWGASAVAYNGRLFIVGGCSSTGAPPCTAYLSSVENYTVRNGGNGMFGTLAANTNPWAYTAGCTTSTAGCTLNGGTGESDTQTVAYNNNIYVIGGCSAYTTGACTTVSTCVTHAPVNSDGTLGSFSSCTSSPPDAQLSSGQARYGGAAIAYVGRIFLLGGSSSTNADTADVISAPLTATGNVDTTQGWSTNTSMPQARHGFGAAISNGYVYVAGGKNGASLQNNVMYSQIGENGTLINWTTDNTNTFTTARQGLNVVAYNSNLYIGQGVDGSGNALGDVQYTPLATNGSLSSWNYTTTEDQLGKYRSMAAANGYMYFFGSETSGTDVFYTAINSNGTLGNLYRASNSGSLTAQPHGNAVFQSGYFYQVGGCTLSGSNCNTVLPTVQEAGQKAQARIGHYAKMFNTIVNTSPTLVQVNGSGNFDIIMRTEAQGATQWGVAQFISPAYATKFYFLEALDSSGTNVGIAFNYFVTLEIDDSNTGAFPDTGSVGTDIDIYYHPNPGRRLRHGASFTNTGCNSVITNGCLLDTAQF